MKLTYNFTICLEWNSQKDIEKTIIYNSTKGINYPNINESRRLKVLDLEELILLRYPYFWKQLIWITFKIPKVFFTEIEKNNPKIQMGP